MSTPEIPEGTWEYEWVSSVVAKTAEYAGRPSHWNGKLHEQPGPVSGTYERDGSMTVSRLHVLDPARPAYTSGHTLTPDEGYAAAGATRMAVFQARLSLSEWGDDSVPGATQIGSLEDLALERGLADRFTLQYTNRIADDLAVQPLPALAHPPAFPAYTTATDRLLLQLSDPTGLTTDQLRDLIESTERSQRFTVIADRVIDHELGDLGPVARRDQLRHELTGSLRHGLTRLTLNADWATAEFQASLDELKDRYATFRERQPIRDAEIADLRRFLGSYTATSRNGTPRYGAPTDNVRPIGSAKNTDRGLE